MKLTFILRVSEISLFHQLFMEYWRYPQRCLAYSPPTFEDEGVTPPAREVRMTGMEKLWQRETHIASRNEFDSMPVRGRLPLRDLTALARAGRRPGELNLNAILVVGIVLHSKHFRHHRGDRHAHRNHRRSVPSESRRRR